MRVLDQELTAKPDAALVDYLRIPEKFVSPTNRILRRVLYALLALFAEQGSGKSTTGRLLRSLTPGVEDRTADWFVERGVAIKAHDSLDLEWIMNDLLRNQSRALRTMREAILGGGRPRAGAAQLAIERTQLHAAQHETGRAADREHRVVDHRGRGQGCGTTDACPVPGIDAGGGRTDRGGPGRRGLGDPAFADDL